MFIKRSIIKFKWLIKNIFLIFNFFILNLNMNIKINCKMVRRFISLFLRFVVIKKIIVNRK